MRLPRVFLTAEWRWLAMLNYAVEPRLVEHLVPAGTELDFFEGRTFVSLVGFLFLRTKVLGLPIPFHRDFEEVNLRFYVRRREGAEIRRGVVFVREIVPRYAIAKVARDLFNERYVSLPMTHRAGRRDDAVEVEYAWRWKERWSRLSLTTRGEATAHREGSLEQFITEHYWGYSAQPDGGSIEYRVEHEPWRVWAAAQARFEGDVADLYGEDLARVVTREPESALLADGSAVRVYFGRRLVQ